MNKKLIAVLVVLMVTIYSVGTVLAHSSYEDDLLKDHYKEIFDLQKQYFNDEITFNEFWQSIEGKAFHDEDMPCHSGFGMMGFPMIV